MLTSRVVLVTIAALLMLLLEPVVGGLVGLAATVVALGALAVALWLARTPSAPATLEPAGPRSPPDVHASTRHINGRNLSMALAQRAPAARRSR